MTAAQPGVRAIEAEGWWRGTAALLGPRGWMSWAKDGKAKDRSSGSSLAWGQGPRGLIWKNNIHAEAKGPEDWRRAKGAVVKSKPGKSWSQNRLGVRGLFLGNGVKAQEDGS